MIINVVFTQECPCSLSQTPYRRKTRIQMNIRPSSCGWLLDFYSIVLVTQLLLPPPYSFTLFTVEALLLAVLAEISKGVHRIYIRKVQTKKRKQICPLPLGCVIRAFFGGSKLISSILGLKWRIIKKKKNMTTHTLS